MRRTSRRGLFHGLETKLGILLLAAFVHGALALDQPARAQTVDDAGAWLAFFASGDIDHACSERLRWWFDAHARFFDDTDGYGQSIVRPGLGYRLGESATLWAGYAWIHTSPGAGPDFGEHRVWEQITWSEQVACVSLDFRARLEQRFPETGSDTGWRFRQLAAARRPLPCTRHFTLVAWDEIFFHLNDTDWGADSGFDQNRVFAGMGYKPDPASRWRIEAGYLHQFVDRATGSDVSNHLVSVNFYWTP